MRQLLRFALVGVSNTLLSYVVYLGLLRVETPYVLASAVAFAAGAANGYALNRRWTFAASDSARARLFYVLVQGFALCITSALVWSIVAAGAAQTAAYAIALPPVTVASFLTNRAWTFRRPGSRKAETSSYEDLRPLSAGS
jgi:putative flippase GtrA